MFMLVVFQPSIHNVFIELAQRPPGQQHLELDLLEPVKYALEATGTNMTKVFSKFRQVLLFYTLEVDASCEDNVQWTFSPALHSNKVYKSLN